MKINVLGTGGFLHRGVLIHRAFVFDYTELFPAFHVLEEVRKHVDIIMKIGTVIQRTEIGKKIDLESSHIASNIAHVL